jgi:hypothetical protein
VWFSKARASRDGAQVAARHDELVDAESAVLPQDRGTCAMFREQGQRLVEVWFGVAHGELRQPPDLWRATWDYLDGSNKALDAMFMGAPESRPRIRPR